MRRRAAFFKAHIFEVIGASRLKYRSVAQPRLPVFGGLAYRTGEGRKGGSTLTFDCPGPTAQPAALMASRAPFVHALVSSSRDSTISFAPSSLLPPCFAGGGVALRRLKVAIASARAAAGVAGRVRGDSLFPGRGIVTGDEPMVVGRTIENHPCSARQSSLALPRHTLAHDVAPAVTAPDGTRAASLSDPRPVPEHRHVTVVPNDCRLPPAWLGVAHWVPGYRHRSP